MAGEEEADGVELAPQPLRFGPWRGARPDRRRLRFPEQRVLSGRFLHHLAIGDRQHRLDRGKGRGTIGLETIEGARRRKALQRLLVDGARIEPRRHITEGNKRSGPARVDQRLGLRFANALDCAQRVMERRQSGFRSHVEIDEGFVDRRRDHLDAETLRLSAEFGELVGVALVERH